MIQNRFSLALITISLIAALNNFVSATASEKDIVYVELLGDLSNAINAAPDGGTVIIGPGIFNETPIIQDKNLTLIGSGVGVTIIRCPNAPMTNSFLYTGNGITYFPVLTVENTSAVATQTVTIENLSVDGDAQGANAPGFFVGVGYHNASGTISSVQVENITFPAAPGDQTGNGIEVANDVGTNFIDILNSIVSTCRKDCDRCSRK